MSRVKNFEGLDVWQNARSLVNRIYDISKGKGFSRDYALRDQIRRAAVSIPSNVSEGFARRSNKEFTQFLFIAKGSAAEVQSQLYTALDQDYISKEEFGRTYEKLETIAKQLSSFITYLRNAD